FVWPNAGRGESPSEATPARPSRPMAMRLLNMIPSFAPGGKSPEPWIDELESSGESPAAFVTGGTLGRSPVGGPSAPLILPERCDSPAVRSLFSPRVRKGDHVLELDRAGALHGRREGLHALPRPGHRLPARRDRLRLEDGGDRDRRLLHHLPLRAAPGARPGVRLQSR